MQYETMPHASLSDEELCTMSAAGDACAEEALVMRYSRLVRICSRLYYLAGGDGEDLIQEGMLGLLSAIRSYDAAQAATFHTFAETCIKNRLLSAVKAATRNKHSPLNHYLSFDPSLFDGQYDQSVYGANLQPTDNPEDLLIDREELQEQMTALKCRLSGLEARILDLYLIGLSYAEIAVEINKSSKSVDNAVQRIRRKVGRQFSIGGTSES
ncbi:MAG: sigma-70 family RNA polymerase sigma factor [Oscillospiraceae bacterium]|nr:sigma-70 family RNA polymerase sigma factor [Oscillospiraceae bacterium]